MVKAVAGRPLALECVARGHPPPTLSWHHEGLPVAESNETWLVAAGGVLSLESVGEASGGLYSCVASSPAGEAVLRYSVEVQGEPRSAPRARAPPPTPTARGPPARSLGTGHHSAPPHPPVLLVNGLDVYQGLPEAPSWAVGSGSAGPGPLSVSCFRPTFLGHPLRAGGGAGDEAGSKADESPELSLWWEDRRLIHRPSLWGGRGGLPALSWVVLEGFLEEEPFVGGFRG